MELIHQDNTILIFYILDFKNINFFEQIKINNRENELSSFKITKSIHEVNIKISEEKRNQIINIIILNKYKSLNFEIKIIKNQINSFFLLINEINGKAIEFIYKNYTDNNETFKNIQIEYDKKNFYLNFDFIDKAKKIWKFILLNISLFFKIRINLKNEIQYDINDNENVQNWLYCLKQYENEVKLTCHKTIKNNILEIKNKNEMKIYEKLKDYIKNIDEMFKKITKKIALFISLKDIIKNIEIYLINNANIFNKPIDDFEEYTIDNYINLSDYLYLRNIVLIYKKYQNSLLKVNDNDDIQNTINIINNYFTTNNNVINNFKYSQNKLFSDNKIDNYEKAKKLALINSIIIEIPEGKYNIDHLEEVNLNELKNINNKNYYVQAREIFQNIIKNLTYDSLLTQCGLELNSNFSDNYNIYEEKKSLEINIISLEDLKNHLLKVIPDKIYRIYYDNDNYSYFEPISKNIVMNEKIIFHNLSKIEINKIFNSEDKNGNYTLSVLFLYFYEIFGHAKIRVDDSIKESPIKFNYKGYLISLLNEKNIPFKESGCIVEKYLTDFNIENKLFLLNSKSKDVNALLDYKLYIWDLKDFNKIIIDINSENIKEVSDFKDYLIEYENSKNKDFDKLNEEELLANIHKFMVPKNDDNRLKFLPIKNYVNESTSEY